MIVKSYMPQGIVGLAKKIAGRFASGRVSKEAA